MNVANRRNPCFCDKNGGFLPLPKPGISQTLFKTLSTIVFHQYRYDFYRDCSLKRKSRYFLHKTASKQPILSRTPCRKQSRDNFHELPSERSAAGRILPIKKIGPGFLSPHWPDFLSYSLFQSFFLGLSFWLICLPVLNPGLWYAFARATLFMSITIFSFSLGGTVGMAPVFFLPMFTFLSFLFRNPSPAAPCDRCCPRRQTFPDQRNPHPHPASRGDAFRSPAPRRL